MLLSNPSTFVLNVGDDGRLNSSAAESWVHELLQQNLISPRMNVSSLLLDANLTTTKRPFELNTQDTAARIVIEVGTPPPHSLPNSEEALLNRSSVLFVAVSFILLMVISLAWLVFYYVQRFRYLHSKERVSRRLAELARKAVARIPLKTLQPGDRETNSDVDQCAICIEPFRPLDNIRVLPCRHYFHKVCIDPWLLEQRSCPMCKLDILQAYGLRTDLYFGSPASDSIGGPIHTSTFGHPLSGLASSSESDDAMERLALVHSHSRSVVTASNTVSTCLAPSLTYVVLTTAATTDPSYAVTTALYYVRRSSSELFPPLTVSQTLSNDSSSHVSSNQLIVSVLPTFPPDPSDAHGNFVVWNPDICVTAVPGVDTIPYHASHSLFDPTSSVTHPLTLTNWQTPVVGVFPSHCVDCTQSLSGSSSMTTATSKTGLHDVTSTTQTFTSPVCSILSDREATDPQISVHTVVSSDGIDHSSISTSLPSTSLVHSIRPPSTSFHAEDASQSSDVDYLTHVPRQLHTRLSGRLLRGFTRPSVSTRTKSNTLIAVRSDRASFMTWLPVPWRRTRIDAVGRGPFNQLGTVSASPTNVDINGFQPDLLHSTQHLEDSRSASQPLLLSSRFPTDMDRINTEQVVFAVVETDPYHDTTGATTDSKLPDLIEAQSNDLASPSSNNLA